MDGKAQTGSDERRNLTVNGGGARLTGEVGEGGQGANLA